MAKEVKPKVVPNGDEQDRQEYEDYVAYQDYLSSQGPAMSAREQAEATAPLTASQIRARRPKNVSDLRAMGEAALGGATQALTLGHTPEIAGFATSKLTGQPYVEARDEAARYLDDVKRGAPATFNLANLGTNLAMPLGIGKTVPRAAMMGAAQGAAYNPGNEEGVVDPMQLDKRTAQALLGMIGGGLTKFGANTLGAWGRAGMMRDRMAKPGFEKELQEEVKSAIGSMRQNYISPRAERVNEVLRGTEIEFNPNILEGTSGINSRGRRTFGLSNPSAGKIQPNGFPRETYSLKGSLEKRANEQGRVKMRGDKANRLRDVLDEKSGISSAGALGSPSVAARGARQGSAAKILRGKVREAAPSTRKDFDEMSYAAGLAQEAREKSKNPQNLLTSQFFGDMGSKLNDIDSFGGSNLRQTAQDLMRARYLSGQTPSAMPMFVREPLRGAENLAATASKPFAAAQALLPKSTQARLSPALIRTLLEARLASPSYEEEEEGQ